MKVNYEYTKDDLKKYLFKSRTTNNIVLLVIGIGIYLYFSLNKISLIYLPLFLLCLILFIYLLNKLYIYLYLKVNEIMNNITYGNYTLELTSSKFSLTLNRVKTDYKYHNIKKIIEKKNSFFLKFYGTRDYLMFEKKLFKQEDYIKIINMFKKKSI